MKFTPVAISFLNVLLFFGSLGCHSNQRNSDDELVDGSLLAATPEAAASPALFTRDGGLTSDQLYTRTSGKAISSDLDKMDFVRPVLKGVLYRGGFNAAKGNGNKTGGLTPQHQKTLCSYGFNFAFSYLDHGTQTKQGPCGDSASDFNYTNGSESDYTTFLSTVWKAINEKKDKVFVHCRWGVHASGFASAIALNQFCGKNKDGGHAAIDFSSKDATFAYWDKARNGAPYGPNWYTKHWSAYTRHNPGFDREISQAQQDEICPR